MQRRGTFDFDEKMKERIIHQTRHSPYYTDFTDVFVRAERNTKEALRQRDLAIDRNRAGELEIYGQRLHAELASERRHCHRDHFAHLHRDLRILAI
jgi:hypothetical protein